MASMPEQPNEWMPRERWEALVAGDGCPLCAELGREESKYGLLVARLQASALWLAKNQYVSGYCQLIYGEHAVELQHLPAEKQAAFFGDLIRAGAAIMRVFAPDKMNYQLLGNLVPHMHWHIIPRYWGDPAPGEPLNPSHDERFLEPAEYRRIIAELRSALQEMEP
jgi:diadenosine tetraphosphate (Ap4A) HIT family hydrolase